jgi:hypothetical protein
MIRIAYVVTECIPCEPGAELCGDCERQDIGMWNECGLFDEKILSTENASELPRRCPACLSAERRAAVRARIAKQTKEQGE